MRIILSGFSMFDPETWGPAIMDILYETSW